MLMLWWRLIRFGFRLLYNELAFTYDLVSWIVSLGAWRCWVRASLTQLDPDKDGVILELAHGTGNLQIDLNKHGFRAVGYDLSPAMGRIAQRKLLANGITPRLTRGKAQQLPFASGTFGAVVSTFPTDFIVAGETLREVERVLRPGGVFVIVPNAVFAGGGVITRLLEGLYRITGQRAGASDEGALASLFAPFDVRIVEQACPHSVVTVIVARKVGEK